MRAYVCVVRCLFQEESCINKAVVFSFCLRRCECEIEMKLRSCMHDQVSLAGMLACMVCVRTCQIILERLILVIPSHRERETFPKANRCTCSNI